jgi:hypothetical protein
MFEVTKLNASEYRLLKIQSSQLCCFFLPVFAVCYAYFEAFWILSLMRSREHCTTHALIINLVPVEFQRRMLWLHLVLKSASRRGESFTRIISRSCVVLPTEQTDRTRRTRKRWEREREREGWGDINVLGVVWKNVARHLCLSVCLLITLECFRHSKIPA